MRRTRVRTVQRLAFTLVLSTLTGCGGGDAVQQARFGPPLEARVVGDAAVESTGLDNGAVMSAAVPRLVLSASPTAASSAQPPATIVLEPELEVRGGEIFAMAVDVAALDDGFAVLDETSRTVVLFDSAGSPLGELGGEGGGPGEFRQTPWAMERLADGRLVVWQGSRASAFTVLDPTGEPIAFTPAPDGDWLNAPFRDPRLDLFHRQFGPEDVTRRLVAHPERGFIHYLQDRDPNGWTTPEGTVAHATGRFLHYRPDRPDPASPVDSILVPGVPVTVGRAEAMIKSSGEGITIPELVQPLGIGRPLLASGSDWLALAHGDSSLVRVTWLTGDDRLIVEWPARTQTMLERDRLETARWHIAATVSTSTVSSLMFAADGDAEREEGVRWTARELMSFTQRKPHVVAMLASGDCLFLAGYSAADWADGTGATWVVIDVAAPSLAAVVRFEAPAAGLVLERRGAVLRDVDERYAYAVTLDGDGESRVLRYELPELPCGRTLPDGRIQ